MTIFKLYIQGILLDIYTPSTDTGRNHFTSSYYPVNTNEHLRTRSIIEYTTVNKPIIDYFTNKLISKNKLKKDHSIQELYDSFKKTSLFIGGDISISIVPHTIHEIKVKVTLDGFFDDILDNLNKDNIYVISKNNNIYVQVETLS